MAIISAPPYAKGLAAAGAAVVVVDLNARGAQSVAAEIKASGGKAVAVGADITNVQPGRERPPLVGKAGKGCGVERNAGLENALRPDPKRDWLPRRKSHRGPDRYFLLVSEVYSEHPVPAAARLPR